MTFFELLLWLKVPLALLGYSRSFFGVLYILIAFPIILFLPRKKFNPKFLPVCALSYLVFTLLLHSYFYKAQNINFIERILFFYGQRISFNSFDNLHITKITLQLFEKGLIWVGDNVTHTKIITMLPDGDAGAAYLGFIDNTWIALLATAQLAMLAVLILSFCSLSTLKSRILIAPLFLCVSKAVFDGGFLAPTAFTALILICILLYFPRITIKFSSILAAILVTFGITVFTSVVLGFSLFPIASAEVFVLERLLTACGIIGITILLWSAQQKLALPAMGGLILMSLSLLVNPVIHNDLVFAYREYPANSSVSIIVNKPNKDLLKVDLEETTYGYQLYSKYKLRPGFDWVKKYEPGCEDHTHTFLLETRGLVSSNISKNSQCQIENCAPSEWCHQKVLAHISSCHALQSGFPELITHCLSARQPTNIRAIIGPEAFSCSLALSDEE